MVKIPYVSCSDDLIKDQKQRRPNTHTNKEGWAKREGKASGRVHKKGIRKRKEEEQGEEEGWMGSKIQHVFMLNYFLNLLY